MMNTTTVTDRRMIAAAGPVKVAGELLMALDGDIGQQVQVGGGLDQPDDWGQRVATIPPRLMQLDLQLLVRVFTPSACQ